jgi:hypothetical protein
MSFEAQQYDVRLAILASKKATTYGTALLDGSFTHKLRFDGGAFAQIKKTFRSDIDRAGKSHPYGTEHQEIMRDTAFSFEQEITDYVAGWLAAFTCSKDTITGAGPYTHTCIFETTTNIAPVTGIYFKDTADLSYKFNDLGITDIEISGTPNGPIKCKVNMIGSGRTTDGIVAAAEALALPTNIYLLGSDTDVLIGAVGAAASIKERVRGWTIKISTGLTVHRGVGGGLFATMSKLGYPRISVSLQVDAKDTDDIRSIFLADTIRELQINTNSGAAAQLNFTFKGLYFTAAQLGTDGNVEVWNIESDEEGIIKNGANEPLTIVAINSVAASYLVAG